ncbi:hypothetical protein X975_10560, partial [Stegodyphus mimosarum]
MEYSTIEISPSFSLPAHSRLELVKGIHTIFIFSGRKTYKSQNVVLRDINVEWKK